MNTLVVCRFGDPLGAESVLSPLRALAREGELVIGDASLVSWPRTARKPSTETLGTLTGPGELWGGSWGVLLGLIFLVPIAGPAFGAAAGAFAGTLADREAHVMRWAIAREHERRLLAALGEESRRSG